MKAYPVFAIPVRWGIFGIDRLLRHCYGVFAFASEEDDILRIAINTARETLTLEDGTIVLAGDKIIDLHVWNERVPRFSRFGPNLGWASCIRRRLNYSFMSLAIYIESDPALRECKALRAETIVISGRGARTVARIAQQFGLHPPSEAKPAGLGKTLVGFGLAWACNPRGVSGKPFGRLRRDYWMSRETFADRYGLHHQMAEMAPEQHVET